MPQPSKMEYPQEIVFSNAVLYNEDYPVYKRRSFGLQMTDIHERVNMDRMRRERLERARSHMKEAGISVMLLLNNANMRYTTAYSWLGYNVGGAYVLLPLEGDPIVFAHVLTAAIQERRQVTWINPGDIRPHIGAVGSSLKFMDKPTFGYVASMFAKQIRAALEERGLAGEVLTLDSGESDIIEFLEKVNIRTSVNREVLVRAQEIKTKDEIECFRACAAIADLVHYELSKYAAPGKTERELAGYMDYIAMKYGAEPTPNCFVASGNHTHPNYRTSTDRMLRVGDIFFADTIQISWNGYKSCCYRNYSCVTPPSQAAIDANKKIIEWTYGALSDCKPGNTTADMMKHWPKDKMFLEGGNGMHGLGLQNYGPPWARVYLSLNFPYELKEGMVFAIEPEIGIGDGQGLRLEEMVVVTKTGCEVLTHAPLEIITCPA